jgi:hypothetical protein
VEDDGLALDWRQSMEGPCRPMGALESVLAPIAIVAAILISRSAGGGAEDW